MQVDMIIGQAKKFMEATEQEIISMFSALPGAQQLEYEPGRPIIFIPGTRKDRVLLVAHYDTVWMSNLRRTGPSVETPREVRVSGMLLESNLPGVGIGADDRLGVLALWAMRSLGHSILLVPDEEIGCLGSTHVASEYPHILKDHSFMMQFDRRGSYDLVYYGFFNAAFDAFLRSSFAGYSKGHGSCTDIIKLIPTAGICGVNISIGFHSEHTSSERVDILDYIRTVYYARNLLKQKNLPTFQYVAPPPPPPVVRPTYPKALPLVDKSLLHTKIASWQRTSLPPCIEIADDGKEEAEEYEFISKAEVEESGIDRLFDEVNLDPHDNIVYCEDSSGDWWGMPLSDTRLGFSAYNNRKRIDEGYDPKTCWCPRCELKIPPKAQFRMLTGGVVCLLCGSDIPTREKHANQLKN